MHTCIHAYMHTYIYTHTCTPKLANMNSNTKPKHEQIFVVCLSSIRGCVKGALTTRWETTIGQSKRYFAFSFASLAICLIRLRRAAQLNKNGFSELGTVSPRAPLGKESSSLFVQSEPLLWIASMVLNGVCTFCWDHWSRRWSVAGRLSRVSPAARVAFLLSSGGLSVVKFSYVSRALEKHSSFCPYVYTYIDT